MTEGQIEGLKEVFRHNHEEAVKQERARIRQAQERAIKELRYMADPNRNQWIYDVINSLVKATND